jgi:DNA invertase Pin-like site-specific DNA recombinase
MEKVIAGYIRVFTREQAIESLSLDRQKESVLNAGAQSVFEDQQSASKSKDTRPELARLLELVRQGKVHKVVTPRMDRMVRSSRNLHKILEVFEDADAEIEFLDIPLPSDNPIFRKMVLNLFGMIAEIETDNLSQRVRSEKRQRRERKLANHNTPFGYVVADGKYKLDYREYLFSSPVATEQSEKAVADSTAAKDTTETDANPEQKVCTVHELAREAITLFLKVRNPRVALHRLFKQFGTTRIQGGRNGSTPVFSWTPGGFTGWLCNPVLRGDTIYLERITNSKGQQENNPDGPIYEPGTHPEERLLSDEEWQAIQQILENNRKIGPTGVNRDPDSPQVFKEFAYLNPLVFCAGCGSKCTPKTAKGKYQYFACRYAGAGCDNRGSVSKAEIEKDLLQQLVQASHLMREEAKEARNYYIKYVYNLLQLKGADEDELQAFAKTTSPRYEHWQQELGWSFKASSHLERLKARRAALDEIDTHQAIEKAKQELDQEIKEEEARSTAFLDKKAAEIIFNGNNLAFWEGLTNDEKVTVFSKVVNKIFVEGRQIKQIYLNIEARDTAE